MCMEAGRLSSRGCRRRAGPAATNQGADPATAEDLDAVLLRVVDGPWPLPHSCQLARRPLAALDLLEYPDPAARHLGREVLRGLRDTASVTVARRTARARVVA